MFGSRLILTPLPTPLHPLEVLSEELGAEEIWIKRDDLTGFAMGGNKVRKAEFLLADALDCGAEVVLTAGAVQSNHARVIATIARSLNLECHLFLYGQASDPPVGNLLLDHLAEAKMHFFASPEERDAAMAAFAEQLRREGRQPYVIPVGGSNAIGAQGYLLAMVELQAQLERFPRKRTWLVFATSSGGTYAGLIAGKKLIRSPLQLLGIRVDHDPNLEERICQVAEELLLEVGGIKKRFKPQEVLLNDEFVGEAYGVPSEAGMEALKLLWQWEGILLDPVYTAKAMAGLIGLVRRGDLKSDRLIFLHTGGAPSVFKWQLSDFGL